MPAKCSVVGCTTKAEKGNGPRFYCIPSEINFTGKASPLRVSRRKKWIIALKLQHLNENQLKNIRVCGQHFITGKPADQYFINHPDWVPSLYLNEGTKTSSSHSKNEFLNFLNFDVLKKAVKLSPSTVMPLKQLQENNKSPDHSNEDLHKYSMPQQRCCVLSCLNRMSKTKNSSPPVYYHKFPEDHLSRNRWMFLCQKKGTWDPDHCYICSDHFPPEAYCSPGELVEFSVPTLKLVACEFNADTGQGDHIALEAKNGVCSVPWCRSTRSEGKDMVLFPEDGVTCNIWIDQIFGAQVPVVPSEKALICQDHFTNDQWIQTSAGKTLKLDAIPVLFNFIQTFTVSKRKTDSSNGKLLKKDSSKECVEATSSVPDKVVKVVRVVKNQILNDHTYSGRDLHGLRYITNGESSQKRKIEALETGDNDDIPKRNKVNLNKTPDGDISEVEGYNNIEELMADLMGESAEKTEVTENNSENIKSQTKDNMTVNNNDNTESVTLSTNPEASDTLDSLDDYSDYSETDSESDSDFQKSPHTAIEKLSSNELKELAEAQKYQLHDLKSENKELVEENERLRVELNLLKSDPEHASLSIEKNKFMSLVVKCLRSFLNTDQILYLIKCNDASTALVWSKDTIKKAGKINQACSDSGYDMLVDSGFPLPPRRLFAMLDRDQNKVLNINDKEATNS